MKLRTVALMMLALGAAPAGPAAAQTTLRIETTDGARTIDGVVRGTPAFPVSALSQLGADVRGDRTSTRVVMFGDTLRFWKDSPFFTSGTSIYQLAFAPFEVAGMLHMPEQLFVQWLPTHYARNLEYRGGALRVKYATASPPPQPVATRQNAGVPSPVSEPPASRGPGTSAKRIIVIDPGHGGTDPGAEGPNGMEEAQTVLLVSKRLASVLSSRGYEVHLTRTKDTLISLADRPRLANRWKGDEPGALFVSIHANSLRGVPQAHGFETYFLSEASTDDERRVAEMENSAVKYEQRPRSGNELEQVLNGLRNDFYLKASNDFAATVQRGMAAFHPGPNRGVKRAPFRVLVGALMPAVLVEIGFITNPTESELMGSSSFQDKLAFSIAESVEKFFRDNEPLWVKQ